MPDKFSGDDANFCWSRPEVIGKTSAKDYTKIEYIKMPVGYDRSCELEIQEIQVYGRSLSGNELILETHLPYCYAFFDLDKAEFLDSDCRKIDIEYEQCSYRKHEDYPGEELPEIEIIVYLS